MLAGRNHDAIEWCEQAIAVAQEVGAPVVEGHARNTLGTKPRSPRITSHP